MKENLQLFGSRVIAAGLVLFTAIGIGAAVPVDFYQCAGRGYIATAYTVNNGTLVMSSRGNDISLLKDGRLRQLVASPGAGMYVNVSADGRLAGFKSINGDGDQAPALLDIADGSVTLLEDYVDQCGQVSFAGDGTMAYTMGNSLIIRKGDMKKTYDLGQYVNIANISPDGKKVAYSDLYGSLYILDLKGDTTSIYSDCDASRAVWSADNAMLAVGCVNGGLFSMEIATGAVKDLGEASSFSWKDDSRSLLVTRSKYTVGISAEGASVIAIDAVTGNEDEVMPLNPSVPVCVSVSGNSMLVSYAAGEERGVKSYALVSDGHPTYVPAQAQSIISYGEDDNVGVWVNTYFRGFSRPKPGETTFTASHAPKLGGTAAGNDIGLLDIPYINQVWDTPAVNGSNAYGYVCCAPSSSCMLLGYLGLVPEHDVYSRASDAVVKICKYSWYVAMEYTSPKTGYRFDTSSSGNGTQGVKGGYGFMWGYGSPYTKTGDFYVFNGIRDSKLDSSFATFTKECNANRPYTICLKNGTGGHVVLGFRVNQQAAADGSETFSKYGSFICHDPYGDYNGASYPNWDGRYASYDWPGFNNGVKNIQEFYWGYTVDIDTEAGINDIVSDGDASDSNAPAELYDLGGKRVDASSAAAGIYIRRQGAKAEKIVIR